MSFGGSFAARAAMAWRICTLTSRPTTVRCDSTSRSAVAVASFVVSPVYVAAPATTISATVPTEMSERVLTVTCRVGAPGRGGTRMTVQPGPRLRRRFAMVSDRVP